MSKSKRPNVVSFIRNGRETGKSDDEIRRSLLDAGWQIDIINHALDKQSARVAKTSQKSSHFTGYNDWYTQRRFVYFIIISLALTILIVLFS